MPMLIIGGTGMLKKASEHFIKTEEKVHLVARNNKRLMQFEDNFPNKKIKTLAIDYVNTQNFIQHIKSNIDQYSYYKKVVCWMHKSGNSTLTALLNLFESYKQPVQFYHILGSAGHNPLINRQQFSQLSYIDYHTIILGFVLQNNASRWLTHSEISEGVIKAVEQESKQCIIGQIEPWELHP